MPLSFWWRHSSGWCVVPLLRCLWFLQTHRRSCACIRGLLHPGDFPSWQGQDIASMNSIEGSKLHPQEHLVQSIDRSRSQEGGGKRAMNPKPRILVTITQRLLVGVCAVMLMPGDSLAA